MLKINWKFEEDDVAGTWDLAWDVGDMALVARGRGDREWGGEDTVS